MPIGASGRAKAIADFTACRGIKKPLQKRRFARALLEQNGLRKARRDFLNTLVGHPKGAQCRALMARRISPSSLAMGTTRVLVCVAAGSPVCTMGGVMAH